MENFIKKITKDVDLSFAILLSFCVYVFFAINIEVFFSHNISFAILERFAVLGLVGLALTICIIAGEIDLSIGSNAALCAVIVVKLTDPLGAPLAMIIGLSVSTLIGATQGFVIAFIRIRAIVITVGTLMLLRGVALLIAEEKTVMLTDFRVPDFKPITVPAKPAQKPDKAKAIIIGRLKGIPAVSASFLAPPIAYISLPYFV